MDKMKESFKYMKSLIIIDDENSPLTRNILINFVDKIIACKDVYIVSVNKTNCDSDSNTICHKYVSISTENKSFFDECLNKRNNNSAPICLIFDIVNYQTNQNDKTTISSMLKTNKNIKKIFLLHAKRNMNIIFRANSTIFEGQYISVLSTFDYYAIISNKLNETKQFHEFIPNGLECANNIIDKFETCWFIVDMQSNEYILFKGEFFLYILNSDGYEYFQSRKHLLAKYKDVRFFMNKLNNIPS